MTLQSVTIKSIMLSVMAQPGACTIKHYESVIYGEMTNFIVRQHIQAWTKTLAYYEVCKLQIHHAFIVQTPLVVENMNKNYQQYH
jgi:hypothetical protein